jgi:hypothetical protein
MTDNVINFIIMAVELLVFVVVAAHLLTWLEDR